MKNKLNIAMITAECVPFAKTGGLADVVGALPQTLRRMGPVSYTHLDVYKRQPGDRRCDQRLIPGTDQRRSGRFSLVQRL